MSELKSRILFLIFLMIASQRVDGQQVKVAGQFSIIVLGDMPYFIPADFGRFENVINAINKENPVFSVHVGDIKSSKTYCTDEYFQKIFGYFGQFKKPLIYTPGDNEWTDCGKVEAGSYDPEERLVAIRKIFFSKNESFGLEKIQLISEATIPRWAKYLENNRWEYNNIEFATVHLVGSNNNFLPTSKNGNAEFFERDQANIVWLNEVFREAQKTQKAGIVLFTQADMFKPDKGSSGFDSILEELQRLTKQYGQPVLLVNGDSHKFLVDKPFMMDAKTKKVMRNFTRVQVFGEQDMHAVKLTFNPSSSSFFSVEQLIVPEN